jgi:hypothetical protein
MFDNGSHVFVQQAQRSNPQQQQCEPFHELENSDKPQTAAVGSFFRHFCPATIV